MGRVVHRPYSSCISNIQNPIETLLSSSYQLRLEVWLSHLQLSCYKYGFSALGLDVIAIEGG